MQVKLGPLVSDAAGSIGGTTVQRNFIATQVRSKPLPTRRRSAYTNQPRGTLGQWSRTWRTLSQSDRDMWQLEAAGLTWLNKFGDVIRGKGYWLYIRCNQYLAMLNRSPITTPGASSAFGAVLGLSAAGAVATTITLTWTSVTPVPAATTYAVFATPPMSAGRSAAYGTFRLLTTFAAGTASPQNIGAAYNTRFGGNQRAGQRTFIMVLPVGTATGYMGTPSTTSFIWT